MTPRALVHPTAVPLFPDRKDEHWRFADLKQLEPLRAATAAPQPSEAEKLEAAARSSGLDSAACRLVFVNDELASFEGADALPSGAFVMPLSEARVARPDLVEQHFMVQKVELGSAGAAELHRANARAGVVIHLPRGLSIPEPIEIFHWHAGDGTVVFPHLLVVADDGAQVTVVEHFRSLNESDAGFAVGVADLAAGPNADIRYVNTQNWNRASRGIQITSTSAARDARVKSFVLNIGGRWTRTETTTHLQGENASSHMLGVSIPDGEQCFDQRTLQLHHAPHTFSDLLCKNALYDRSTTTFAGLIVVDEGAHYTDAYQTCRNLLLSDDCEANAMPGLEINADQVKCSHGATAGQIDADELFYMKARGIPDDVARQLITFGFTQEAVERIDHDAVEALVTRLIADKFARVA